MEWINMASLATGIDKVIYGLWPVFQTNRRDIVYLLNNTSIFYKCLDFQQITMFDGAID